MDVPSLALTDSSSQEGREKGPGFYRLLSCPTLGPDWPPGPQNIQTLSLTLCGEGGVVSWPAAHFCTSPRTLSNPSTNWL